MAVHDHTHALLASCITVSILCTVAVILRFCSRWRAKDRLWWDDWIVLASLILYYGMMGVELGSIANFGLGRHVNVLDHVSQVLPFFKSLMAYQVLYFACQSGIKYSLLCFYVRVFKPGGAFRVTCYMVGALVTAWFIACFFVTIFSCHPVKLFWTKQFHESGHCVDSVQSTYGTGITNLLLDVMALCLSIPGILKLNIARCTRNFLGFIFLLGLFVCAVAIIRIVNAPDFGTGNDPTWSASNIYLWSQVEPACGIICACLPTLNPLISPHARTPNSDENRTWEKRNHEDTLGVNGFSRLNAPDHLDLESRHVALGQFSDKPHQTLTGVITQIEGPKPPPPHPSRSFSLQRKLQTPGRLYSR